MKISKPKIPPPSHCSYAQVIRPEYRKKNVLPQCLIQTFPLVAVKGRRSFEGYQIGTVGERDLQSTRLKLDRGTFGWSPKDYVRLGQ